MRTPGQGPGAIRNDVSSLTRVLGRVEANEDLPKAKRLELCGHLREALALLLLISPPPQPPARRRDGW